MGTSIQTDELTAAMATQSLQDEFDAFLAIRLTSLGWALPGSGSQDHDSRLSRALQDALEAYRQMVTGDISAIQSAYRAFVDTDTTLAKAWAGGNTCT